MHEAATNEAAQTVVFCTIRDSREDTGEAPDTLSTYGNSNK